MVYEALYAHWSNRHMFVQADLCHNRCHDISDSSSLIHSKSSFAAHITIMQIFLFGHTCVRCCWVICTASHRIEMGITSTLACYHLFLHITTGMYISSTSQWDTQQHPTARLLHTTANCPQQRLQDMSSTSMRTHGMLEHGARATEFFGGLRATAACAVLCCPYNTIHRKVLVLYGYWGTAHRQAPVCLHVSAKFAVQC